ncbi:TonB family protein [Tsuneonella amylolytica]|uniref:TonB family protein n=1 Tax=Tsuneonella amylolytica TaxID=2338327 RepID=UPI000EA86E07|nr:TonB family protein [Tsuneonella amylolytica]
MAYLQNNGWKDRPGAIAGVVAVHALVGYALVTGLSFTKIVETVKNPKGIFVPEVKLPPPPPPPDPTPQPTEAVVSPKMVAPKPPVDLNPAHPPVDTTPVIIPVPDPLPYVVPRPAPSATATIPPAPKSTFDAVGALPRGNPGSWVTVDDYRSSWINRELTGVARFRLDIAANGRVSNCTITGSSGHSELDKATCALLTSRARFDPAKDISGAKVAGTYSSAVRWELPD